jgi:hypothetical protein
MTLELDPGRPIKSGTDFDLNDGQCYETKTGSSDTGHLCAARAWSGNDEELSAGGLAQADYLISLSSLLTVASFSVRAMLPLRALAVASQLFAIPYFMLQPTPLWTPVGWTVLFDVNRFMDKYPDLAIKFNDVINRYLVAQINKLALYLDSSDR